MLIVLCSAYLLSHVQLFATPWTVARLALLSMGILQARNLEWVVMSTQGSNPGLPHSDGKESAYSNQGNPRTLEWVASPFSWGSP